MAETVEQAPLEWDTPLFNTARTQYEQALPYADVGDAVAERLRFPERATMVSMPVRMDDDKWHVLPAYRVQHSSVLGPTKGGIRYDPHVSLGECAALAMWMTWKCSLLRLPFGGAKGGVRCNPREMSIAELQRMTRRYTSEMMSVIGPQEDIPAPDMATDEQTMAWMMDTYSMQKGYAVPEVVTGKPISIGGAVFRAEATGAGVVMVIERACERLGWSLDGMRCVVQGFGKVGAVAAAELVERGARVVAVSDVSGGAYAEGGLDLEAVTEWIHLHRHDLIEFPGAEAVTNDELLELPCDVLVLAALEEQVTAENAGDVKAAMVAEGANGPTTLEGDEILADRGILVLPDILTNAGGVTVSYFEWVQDLGRLFWNRDETRFKLREKMTDAFDRVWGLSEERGLTLRSAALVAGIREVAGALTARGIYP
ncbi:MAG: Glu/Leu/Phe/Val dehydrogenase [Actinobacteria bacterium]|nr:Glu/Leu/Phe/Val dehydrogenase [Actinomycetota bacterium]